MKQMLSMGIVSSFMFCAIGMYADAEEPRPTPQVSSLAQPTHETLPGFLQPPSVLLENRRHEALDSSSGQAWSQTHLLHAVETVLQQRPDLILSALENHPVALAELVQRAELIQQRKAEEGQWLAELEDPKTPEISQDRPMRGSPQAPVTIVEYSDFECPYCQAVSPTLMEVFEDYKDQVRFVYKHNPLSFHPTAEPAARYFEAIALQSKDAAWQFHDRVFEEQHNLAQGVEILQEIVAGLEIDRMRLKKDLHSEAVQERLDADLAEAQRFGFDGTPAFVINGVSLVGNHPKRDFERIIDLVVAKHQED